MKRTRLLVATALGLVLSAGAVPPVSATTGTADAAPSGAAAMGKTATVRLITGDRVTVTTGAAGRSTASVEPGTGRRGVLFRTIEQDGHLSVIPSDASDLVATGRLDRELFDVTALVSQQYDEAHTDALPLIVAQGEGVADGTMSRLTRLADDGAPAHRLDSIGALSLRVAENDLGTFWKQLASGGSGDGARAQGTPRVWLDSRVRPSLDRSTAQIGTPAAWQAGLRGESVKVAVLDTGADASHPDLAGRIAQAEDFSGSSGTGDAFGHGTHVASIVAGSGAASGGTRKGVAPDADLLIGKVLGDDGYGTESQVVAGMEWAAAQGAEVVNMSLGSEGASDGQDPMSLALNALTENTGALFVVAAGNAGEQGQSTVGSPGAADAALTVGAVDRADSLASFSSRGPRAGDKAVKPDVTAPGVGIVAARAADTTMGHPVDAHHVAASGTSMAAPHVAGVAALLAQRHPDWGPERLKDALVSTSRTVVGQKVTEQGGGRVDVAAAVLGPLTATGTVALGTYETGDGSTRSTKVRYTNHSGEDLTLALDVRLATTAGREAAEGAVRPGTDSLRVAAGKTVDVPVTVDPSRLQRGAYYGYATATSADGEVKVHTTLSLLVKGPVHRLTVTTYDDKGNRSGALPTIWGTDGFVRYADEDRGIAEVEEGTYQLDLPSIASDGSELRHVILPEVKVTEDMAVTLDERKTTKVEIRTPRPAEQRGIVHYQMHREIDGVGLTQGVMYFDSAQRIYVSPTAQVTDGTFEFASRWQLVAPLLRAEVPASGIDLQAYYMPQSPLLDDRGRRLTAVDAGDASAPRFDRARGKLAVVTNRDNIHEPDMLTKAAEAGVTAVALVHFSNQPWTRWEPDGDRWALPTVRIGADAGAQLLARIKDRRTQVHFTGTARSPYLYDVMQISSQRIPNKVVHTVTEDNSAVIRTTYADNGGTPWASEQRFARRPYQDFAWLQYSRYVPTGFERTEYVSAGDTAWQHKVHHETISQDRELTVGMRSAPRTYRAGEQLRETWNGSVVRPSIPHGAGLASVRDGNVLALRIPEFTDSTSGHWSRKLESSGGGGGIDMGAGASQQGDTARAVLLRDGKKFAEAGSAWTDFEVPAGAADYRLDLSTSRASDEWAYGTATETSWSFRSAAGGEAKLLPLLQLDYDVPVDERNEVKSGRMHAVRLAVRAQDGLAAPKGVVMKVEASYDDGRTWSRASLRGRGADAYEATVTRPSGVRGDAYVTLRVTARDAAGNSVRQTVTRAYLQQG
ncbi:S8 family serine peptidase [Streptomyces sp. PSKA30]|uniref:S8 family peptidase n=1 Tax=Streptomyces sp. PSKA30 TaxID=2874597 RepID=UPI001CD0FB8A|nr:S8 family serine peptidase [Streptomyces sp. PSKA30]MBZ9644511.1 S8 family peptidase [Streptomyces sp. PSKA30]